MSQLSLLLAVWCATAAAGVAQEVLRYDVVKNSRHEFTLDAEVHQTSSMGEADVHNTITSHHAIALTAVDDVLGKLTLDVALDTSNVTLNIGAIDNVLDARDSVVRQTGLSPIRYTILPNGTVVSALATGPTSRIAVEFSNPIGIVFPSTPLVQGASWTQTLTDSVPAAANGMLVYTRTRRYTVERFADTMGTRCVVLSLRGSSGNARGGSTLGDIELTLEGEEETRGTCVIELSTGLPVLIEASSSTSIRMAFVGMANIIVPMTIERRETLRRRR